MKDPHPHNHKPAFLHQLLQLARPGAFLNGVCLGVSFEKSLDYATKHIILLWLHKWLLFPLSTIWPIPEWLIELPSTVYIPTFCWYFCLPLVLSPLHHQGIFLAENLTGKNDLSIISFLGSNEHPLFACKLSFYACFVVLCIFFSFGLLSETEQEQWKIYTRKHTKKKKPSEALFLLWGASRIC